MKPVFKDLESLFELHALKITKYNLDKSKTRVVTMASGGTLPLSALQKKLYSLPLHVLKFPSIGEIISNSDSFADLIAEYAAFKNIAYDSSQKFEMERAEIPEELKGLVLNVDISHPGRELKYFLTKEDYIHPTSGWAYIRSLGAKEEEIFSTARQVHPVYLPRSLKGTSVQRIQGHEVNCLNTYVPPKWMSYKGDLPDKLPNTFVKLINHLFPIKLEREYFFDWLYKSLFKRSFVYLVLCGAPGIGKNRLKIVMRALHGHTNTVDGKKSTITERFNSQLAESTLAWFDELHYNQDMENFMKEVQNDTMSIERKGVDATRATRLYASSVVSNNRPRDNYISFESRKFVPLSLGSKRLEQTMSPEEIDSLTNKVENESSPSFDIKYIAQIGRWVQKNGHSGKWPNSEYRGPMFYKLAHTSMSRWQKKAAMILFEPTQSLENKIEGDKYSWSAVEDVSRKKNGDRSLDFPDYSTVKSFFDSFLNGDGEKSFWTKIKPGNNPMGDFWVKCIGDAKIITEHEIIEEEEYDL